VLSREPLPTCQCRLPRGAAAARALRGRARRALPSRRRWARSASRRGSRHERNRRRRPHRRGIGGSLELETIAAAVIGGACLRGGEGGASSALAGALFITVLSNGMNLARIDGYVQQLCIGAIINPELVFDRSP